MFDGMTEKSKEFYRELAQVEIERKALQKLSTDTSWKILFRYKNTVYSMTLHDSQLYIAWTCFILTKTIMYINDLHANGFPLTCVIVFGSMVSFLLVFYSNECYQRFMAQHGLQTEMVTRIVGMCMHASTKCSPLVAQQILRYMNVAHVLSYTGFTEAYTIENFYMPIVHKYKLLTDEEYEGQLKILDTQDVTHLYRNNMRALDQLMSWSFSLIYDAVHSDDEPMMLSRDKGHMQNELIAFRGAIAKLNDFRVLSIPFAYVNLVATLILVYCPAFAIAVALSSVDNLSYVYGFCVVLLNSIFMNGLFILGRILQDPFGSDREDLSVLSRIEIALDACMSMIDLQKTHRAKFDPKIENDLFYLHYELDNENRVIEYSQDANNIREGTPVQACSNLTSSHVVPVTKNTGDDKV